MVGDVIGHSSVLLPGVIRWTGSDLEVRRSDWVSMSFDPDAQEESKWNVVGSGLCKQPHLGIK